MRIIHQPSDKFFKQSLLDPRVAKELFIKHLPSEIKSLIDMDCMNVVPNSFIDEAFKGVEADVLYEAKLINQEASAYIYLLCENQTSIDEKMAFRLLVYMVRIMEMHIKKHPKSPLPLIYPLVVYAGEKPWNAPLDIFSLFGEHAETARKILLSSYQLIDINRLSDEDLKKNFWIGIVEFVLKYRKVRDFSKFLDTLLPWLQALEKQNGTGLARIVIQYVVDGVEADNEQLFIEKSLECLSGELKGEVMTLADKFIEKGKIDVAKNMLAKGMDPKTTAELTGLSVEKIEKIKKEN